MKGRTLTLQLKKKKKQTTKWTTRRQSRITLVAIWYFVPWLFRIIVWNDVKNMTNCFLLLRNSLKYVPASQFSFCRMWSLLAEPKARNASTQESKHILAIRYVEHFTCQLDGDHVFLLSVKITISMIYQWVTFFHKPKV